MLDDDELQALREIGRRLRWESPELAQLFDDADVRPRIDHGLGTRARVLLGAAAVTGLALLGPRTLNEGEVRTRRRSPMPRTVSVGCTHPRRADAVSDPATPSGPIAAVEVFVAPSIGFQSPPVERIDV
jgi:hypothetical protein